MSDEEWLTLQMSAEKSIEDAIVYLFRAKDKTGVPIPVDAMPIKTAFCDVLAAINEVRAKRV